MNLYRWTVLTLGVAALLLVAAPQAVTAASHQEGGYAIIHYDDVGPANSAAFEENSKAWVAAFEEAEAGEEWAWRTYSGPNFEYAFLTDVPNYAYLDSDDERWAKMVEVVGQEKIDELSASTGSMGHRHEMTKRMPALDYTPESGVGKIGYVHLSTHYVKPGMGEDFERLMKKVVEARKQDGGGLAIRVSKVEFGQGSYHVATLAPDRASYYSQPPIGGVLAAAYGPEGAQAMFDDWTGCITDYKTGDWAFEPELSYLPGMYGKMMGGETEEMMDGDKDGEMSGEGE